ncbi:hypothetical protein B7R21_01505 [Subtercola boreus]|uniref:Uncharacterized protein n=1 Tax=Subtercola boreus TaxID=120213 RepID=A0A3E0W4U9_9MICO|nr:hypothetical protein [Subtercola boreus]RFA16815.1 hypothetical protein B7R21_01505 [Subtercola boreus]
MGFTPTDGELLTSPQTQKGLTRRQVAVGAAWSLPVIALAVAAPAHAASAPVVVPGQPATYPDATFSATTQLFSNPSLKSATSTGFAKTTFTAATEEQEYASYKPGWTFVVSSTAPLTNITFDTSTLSSTGSTIVNGQYVYSWVLNTATISTFVRVKPSAFPQSISFALTDTTAGVVVGEATATVQP